MNPHHDAHPSPKAGRARQLLASAAAVLALTGAPGTSQAGPPAEPGLMLRPGTWDGDIGTYHLPAALQSRKPAQWPNEGWQRLSITGDQVRIEAVRSTAGKRPAFLADIAAQVSAAQTGQPPKGGADASASQAAENVLFVRFPQQPLRIGMVTVYRFKNGTSTLTPLLDHRYELQLGTQAFAFSVRNGQKGRHGGSFGEGARYTIEYDGLRFDYHLPEFGWDSKITAIADFDGDGKPDFLIGVAGNNSSFEYLLLSTLAKPGMNPPSAALMATGC